MPEKLPTLRHSSTWEPGLGTLQQLTKREQAVLRNGKVVCTQARRRETERAGRKCLFLHLARVVNVFLH